MKKLILICLCALMILAAGCGSGSVALSDEELLERAYSNMEAAESSHLEASFAVSAMGMRMEPIHYEILQEYPDRTYMKLDVEDWDTGELTTLEILMDGDNISLRSDSLDALDAESRALLEELYLEEIENPGEYENIFLDLEQTTNFSVIDNPAGLDAEAYRTYLFTLDGDKLTEMVLAEMDLQDELFPAETEDLEEWEIEMLEAMTEMFMASLSLEMEAILVVDVASEHFHSLSMDIKMELPLGELFEIEKEDDDFFAFPDMLQIRMEIELEYLAINTELEFPEFE
ncbi:MAG: hypothetical protein FH749_12750 [Firmicutes bacterium]|nr:hypothetical protein [Bacillota bacterium]